MPPDPAARLAILADDLTGAADTAAGLLPARGAVVVSWPDPDIDAGALARARVLALDAGTRVMAPAAAESRTFELARRLRDQHFGSLYKKADSTLRGHVGVEVRAAIAGWHPGAVALVALAFPATDRTTVAGRQQACGVPLPGPALPELFGRCGLKTVHAPLETVRAGELPRLLAGSGDAAAVVCDAATDADLRAIAAAGHALERPVVWVGSGGLARALGRTSVDGPSPPFPARPAHPTLIVVGSTHPVSRAQVSAAAAGGAVHVRIEGTHLALGTAAARHAAEEVHAWLLRGTDVVVTVDGEDGSDPGIVRTLGRLLRPCAASMGCLVATGGDTASAVLRAWHVRALQVLAEVEPGVPMTVACGARPFYVVLKAGAFGSPSALARAREAGRSTPRSAP